MQRNNWQPAASPGVIKKRAQLLAQIRAFMDDHAVQEVETPILNRSGATDPDIQSVTVRLHLPDTNQSPACYLHTSPEFAMKRLLAAGSGPIYQITRVFRDGEAGRWHQPEFTMLEWYRPGFDHHALMTEIETLLISLGLGSAGRAEYGEVFAQATGLDPHTATMAALNEKAQSMGLSQRSNDRATVLEFLFSHCVSPGLGQDNPLFVFDYPACQAALARITTGRPPVAERFELFINGMEIANGFNELCDAGEQRERFELENRARESMDLPQIPVDEQLLSALEHGLPSCAGVALGVDRLLMVLTGCDHIDDVLTFPF